MSFCASLLMAAAMNSQAVESSAAQNPVVHKVQSVVVVGSEERGETKNSVQIIIEPASLREQPRPRSVVQTNRLEGPSDIVRETASPLITHAHREEPSPVATSAPMPLPKFINDSILAIQDRTKTYLAKFSAAREEIAGMTPFSRSPRTSPSLVAQTGDNQASD